EGLATILYLHRPGSSALGVARSQMCDQHSVSQLYFVTIMQHAVYFRWFVVVVAVSAILEISLAAGLDNIHVSIHHVILRAGKLLHQSAARTVVPMRMANEKNLGIAEVEPKL